MSRKNNVIIKFMTIIKKWTNRGKSKLANKRKLIYIIYNIQK